MLRGRVARPIVGAREGKADVRIRIEFDVKGDGRGVLRVVDELLDLGTIQDAIDDGCSDHEVKAEIEDISVLEVDG
jgi:hypothetical protein